MRLDTAAFIVPVAALICLNLIVIVGNVMVIMAVFTHSKLRSMTTNKFIVSLAFADLMVGVVVLPFSSANEVCAVESRQSTNFSINGSVLCVILMNYIDGGGPPSKRSARIRVRVRTFAMADRNHIDTICSCSVIS